MTGRTLPRRKAPWAFPGGFLCLLLLPAAAAAGGERHVVRRGETLSKIAVRHGVSVTDLVDANRSRHPRIAPDHVEAGWSLRIPDRDGDRAKVRARGGGEATVRRGETLSEIADRYGVSVADLVAANRARHPRIATDHVEAGWRLALPGAASTRVTVRRGETLSEIAARHDVSVADLLAVNRDRYPRLSRIFVAAGWELVVPGRAHAAPPGRRYLARRVGRDGPTITFKPEADRPIRAEVADRIERILVRAGVRSVEVSSTTDGVHAPRSRHDSGRAVDISRINGRHVRDLGDHPWVRRLQEAARAERGILENFGPSRIERKNRPYRPRSYRALRRQHLNHIHFSW